jgi:two-component system phosphate regulon sensor histidine kinase PhoR
VNSKTANDRIVLGAEDSGGPPVIRHTQVLAHEVLELAASGMTADEIVAQLPELEPADVKAALEYAAGLMRQLDTDGASPASLNTEPRAGMANLDLKRILVVDDHEMNRLYMQALFRDSEYTISVAADGEEGLAKARAELPFLILADVQMPHIDGFELCRQLKADERTKGAAVIFITAHHRSSQKVSEGLDIGADDYIFRPFERGELMSRVRAVARLKQAEEEARRQAEMVERLYQEVQTLNRHLEQKVAERTRELAEEKEKTEAILASLADGLLVLDADNRILTANAVAESMLDFRLGRAQGQAIGKERLTNSLWRCINDLVSGDEFTPCASVDVPDPTQLGGVLSIQALAARVRDDSGNVIGTVIALRDITGITQVERMKARFMAGVTHELKTPLSIIQLHTNNLQAYHGRLPEEKRDEFLSAIQSQVQLLEHLVEDVLELSYLDAGETKGKRQRVDLIALADEVISDLRPLADRKQVALRWERPDSDITVLGVNSQMKRLILNLVDNAIKYTPVGGSVELGLSSKKGESVSIEVSDTGIGISPEHQSLIFDRFYRVDPSHTVPGTGLGLAIVKEIAASHGGDVQLISRAGKGSVFVVTLPRVSHESERPAR